MSRGVTGAAHQHGQGARGVSRGRQESQRAVSEQVVSAAERSQRRVAQLLHLDVVPMQPGQLDVGWHQTSRLGEWLLYRLPLLATGDNAGPGELGEPTDGVLMEVGQNRGVDVLRGLAQRTHTRGK